MNLERYPYLRSHDYLDYEFYSEGPRGKIKKIVMFTKIQGNPIIYNLAFGDEDPLTGIVNDLVTTDNSDRDMVLATVAHTVNDFCDHYGNHFIYAKGSTLARTRLYQMSLSNLLDEISIEFDVFGLIGAVIYKFQKNVNYDALLVKRK